ncbi:MAG TPA: sigma-70 family RNA polymerase sigma factor [Gemmatimonadaceae bacterium]
MSNLAELFDAHHRSLFRYLVRLCGDADVAEDATQEAFMRVLERPPVRNVERAWLFKVATNAALEHLRTRTRRKRILAGIGERAPMGDPPPDPHEHLEANERHQLVVDALARLSPKERMAVLMREEGFSHHEIAEAVGTTTGSVGTLLARALTRLAAALPHPDAPRASELR